MMAPYGRPRRAPPDPGRMVPANVYLPAPVVARVEKIAAIHGISVSRCLRILVHRAIAAPVLRPGPAELDATASRTDREHRRRGGHI